MMSLKLFIEPDRSQWAPLCRRAADDDPVLAARVGSILQSVRLRGDAALLDFERQFDGLTATGTPQEVLQVGEAEIQAAFTAVPEDLKEAIEKAASAIRKFHEAQLPAPVRVETFPGVTCTQQAVPIRRVGLYIPGGSAPLFSTVLMLAIPARVAGCEDVLLCSPPGADGRIHPAVVYAARLCGVRNLFKLGGAQAIAAMAYGTETVSRRDKIFGPGNRYVMNAKQLVSLSDVAVDMPAGPSEVMVLADATAVPAFVAAALLSQAEHGPDSQSMLVCASASFAERVTAEIDRQAESLARRDIIRKALDNSRTIVLNDRRDRIDFANEYAPEHLIIAMRDPRAAADSVYAAGSVFLGNYSPESAGDYASGTNHTLPTSGWARSFSGLGVESFLRRQTCQELTKEGLASLAGTIRTLARAEGLDAHAAAVEIRLENDKRSEL